MESGGSFSFEYMSIITEKLTDAIHSKSDPAVVLLETWLVIEICKKIA